MIQSHLGEFVALITAMCWTATSLAFESASKKVGSLLVNLFRLILAFLFLGIFSYFYRGLFFPTDATGYQWFWLSLSAIFGFIIGDTLLLKALIKIGARISLLIMALSPVFAAITGFFILGEAFTLKTILGMAITLCGISIVIIRRKSNEKNSEKKSSGVKLKYPVSGILFALGGAAGQGIGLVLSKLGMGNYNAFAAAEIRVFVGAIGFLILFFVLNRWRALRIAITDKKALIAILIGTIFGPFLGVSFSLLSVQYTSAGIAQTIMSLSPVLIIIPSAIIHKEKITLIEIIGAIISVGGVSLFFL